MRTHDVFGINNGLEPDENGPVARRQTVVIPDSLNYVWDSNGGQGSSVFATKAFQTIFIDNSLGTGELRVNCFGTRHSFKCPAKSQGYFPLVALRDDYSFEIVGTIAGQVFEVTLFNIMLPTAVWSLA